MNQPTTDPAVEAAREIRKAADLPYWLNVHEETWEDEIAHILRRHFPAKAAASSDTKELRKRGEDLLDYGNPFQSHGESLVTAADTIDSLRADLAAAREGLYEIDERGCKYESADQPRPSDCECSGCIARRTLAAMKEKKP